MKPTTTRRVAGPVLVACWSCFCVIAFFGSLPDSPMRLSKKHHLYLASVLPEGWSFFTRSPREEEISAFGRDGGAWRLLNFRASSSRSWFGLRRTSRVQGVEFGGLAAQIPDSSWSAHSDPFSGGADLTSIPRLPAGNTAVRKTMCGEVLLQKKPPVPWAWSRSGRPVAMPAKYVLLQVDCAAPPPANDPHAPLLQSFGTRRNAVLREAESAASDTPTTQGEDRP